MQDSEEQDIIELLSQAAAIKTRLRQIGTARQASAGSTGAGSMDTGPSHADLDRAKKHLELALEALGTAAWGFAPTASSSLKITGFHTPDIYKALEDIRSRTRGDSQPATSPEEGGELDSAGSSALSGERRRSSGSGRRKADRISQPWMAASKRAKKADQRKAEAHSADESAKQPSETQLSETQPQEVAAQGSEQKGDGNSSVWVKHRVNEIQRALSAAFGEDDFLGAEEASPKPFAAPEFMGNTDALSVPELIGFFQLQGKTGVLTIDARHEQFTLEYLRGELIHAGSSSSPDGQRLGEVLVKLGHLTQSKLERLLAGKSAAERLGDALRRGEVVAEEALAEALQYQIQNIFYRLFDLGGCRFTFREGLEGEPKARVRYNVTRLLLETARHRDELEGQADRQAG